MTGAGGRLGTVLRAGLIELESSIRWTDQVPVDGCPNFVLADLNDRDAVKHLLEGIDVVVHMAATSDEDHWAELQRNNIEAVAILYDVARRVGVRRVILASSFHVMGFYDRTELTRADSPLRPDSLYAVTKIFGESVARYYWDKFELESLIVRVGSCNSKPTVHGMLGSWLSPRDFTSLIVRGVTADRIECMVVHGVSANAERWFDDPAAEILGWIPQDSADRFREDLLAAVAGDPCDPVNRYKGGVFAARGAFGDD